MSVLPKALKSKDNVSMDDHGRRLFASTSILENVIKQLPVRSAEMHGTYAAAKGVMLRILRLCILMERTVDGSSASLTLLPVVRGSKIAWSLRFSLELRLSHLA